MQVAGSALVSTLFSTGLVHAQNVGWSRVGGLFFFFALGAVWSREIRDLVARARPVHLVAAFAVFVVVSALILLGLRWIPFLALVGQVAAVAAGIMAVARFARWRLFGMFEPLGVNSLRSTCCTCSSSRSWSHRSRCSTRRTGPGGSPWPCSLCTPSWSTVAASALAHGTSRVRWLYVPPAFLRPSARSGGGSRGARADVVSSATGSAATAQAAVGDALPGERPAPPSSTPKDHG